MHAAKNIAGILLAAGFSRRLGRPKQTVVLGGKTLLERAVLTAREAGLNPLLAVLNTTVFASEAGKLERLGCTVLVNTEAIEGMASSIRLGIGALEGISVRGALVMTCDQVAMTSEHLHFLCAEPLEAAGSAYAGKTGVPAYFPVKCFGELLALRGDQGARELLKKARSVTVETLALDVDTEEELVRAETWLQAHEAMKMR